MALVFSKVTIDSDGESVEFLVSGSPRNENGLKRWVAYEDFIKTHEGITTAQIQPYSYGNAQPYKATPEEVAYMDMRWKNQPGFLESRCTAGVPRTINIRNILYGYQCVDGKMEFHPQESTVMKEIFKAYTEGKSLLELSKWLNERQIEYMPGVIGWNKSRIMRLLEDKRYLGDDRYPALIDQGTYDTVQEMRYNRCDQKNVDRQADIFQIDIPVRCPTCNGVMKRKVDVRRTDSTRWRCQNPECRASVAKTDESLFDEMTELLNTAIANPEMITIPTEKEIESSMELRRLNNEITRAFDSIQIDRNAVREMMIRYASLKYAELDSAVCRAQRLKDIFITSQPLTAFSVEFLHSTTDEIMLYTDGTIGLILENRQEIRKGANHASNGS